MSEKYPSSNSTGSFSTTTPKRAVFQEAKTYYVNYVEGLEALAASRLALLRRCNEFLKHAPEFPLRLVREYDIEDLQDELAKELGDD